MFSNIDLDQAGFLTVITSLLASLCVAIWLHDLLWGEPSKLEILCKHATIDLGILPTIILERNIQYQHSQ